MLSAPSAMDVAVSFGRAELCRFGFPPVSTPRATDDSGLVLLSAAFVFLSFNVVQLSICSIIDPVAPDRMV